MAKFKLTKKIELGSVLGEGHESDYLRFTPLTFKDATDLQKVAQTDLPDLDDEQLKKLSKSERAEREAKQMAAAEAAQGFIKAKLVGGKITDEDSGTQVDVTQDDFDALPVPVVNYCMQQLSGQVSPDLTTA